MAYDGEIIINTKIDTDSFDKGLSSVSSSLTGLTSKFDAFGNKGLSSVSLSLTELTSKFDSFGNKSSEVSTQFESQMAKMGSLSEVTANDLAQITEKAKEMSFVVATGADESREAFEHMTAASQKTAEAVSSITEGGNLSSGLSSIDVSLGALSAGMIAFGKQALDTGMQFESQMSKVGAISGASAAELALLTDKAKEMGAATSFSARESGEAFEYMAMAGWKTSDMIAGISGIMDAAAASGEDLGTVADIITDGLTAFGMKAEESSRYADVLAAASANSNTNIGMMGETFKYVAPLAGAMGFEIESVAVATGLMANSGIKASQAGTAMRGLFTRLAKPTKESAEAMHDLNISIVNSDGTMKSLDEILLSLRSSFSDLTEEQKISYAAMLAGQEGMSGLLAIVNATDEEFNTMTDAMQNANGAAGEMAAQMRDNLSGQIEELGGGIETASITMTEALAPAISFVVSILQTLVDGFNSLPQPIQNTVVQAAAFATAFMGIKTAVSTAQAVMSALNTVTQQTAAASKSLVTAQEQQILSANRVAQAQISEAESALRLAKAKETLLTANTESSSKQEATIAASIKLLEAQNAEAQATLNLAKAQEAKTANSNKATIASEQEAQASLRSATEKVKEAQAEVQLAQAKDAHQASLVKLEAAKATQTATTQKLKEVEAEYMNILSGAKDGDYVKAYYAVEDAKKAQALATAQVVVAEKEEALTSASLTAANSAQTVSTTAGTVANRLNAASLKAMTAAMLASPLFIGTVAVAAISGIISAIDYLSKSYERQVEKVKDLSREYDELQNNLRDIESELEDTKSKIDELNSKEKLTVAEENELQNLQNINTELERRLEIEKGLAEVKARQLEQETVALFNQGNQQAYNFGSTDAISPTQTLNPVQIIEEQIRAYEQLEQKLITLKATQEELANTGQTNSQAYQENAEQIKNLTGEMDGLEVSIRENALSLEDYRSNLSGTSEESLATMELIDGAMSLLFEKLGLTVETTEDMVEALDEVVQAFENGEISSEDFTKSLEEQLSEIEELIKANPELADSYNVIKNKIVSALSKSPKYFKDVEVSTSDLRDATSDLISETDFLAKAMDEQNETGRISNSTMLDLIDSGYALALQINEETGAIELDEEAMMALTEAKIQNQIANLELARSNIESDIAAEGEAAAEATGKFLAYSLAIEKSRQAFEGDLASIDLQIAGLEDLMNNLANPRTFKSSGGGGGSKKSSGGGGGKKSERVKEAKEEIDAILKEELRLLEEQEKLGDISAKEVYNRLKEITASRKLNSKEQEEIQGRLFKSQANYFDSEADLIKKKLKREEITNEEAYAMHQNLYNEMLTADHLYAKDREKVEESLWDAKNELLEERTDRYIEGLELAKEQEEQIIEEQIETVKEKEYQKIEIAGETSDEIYEILSDEYIRRISLIDDETGAYLEGVNEKIKAELDLLGIQNEEAYDKITKLKEENELIKERQKLQKEADKEEQNNKKLAELQEKISTAEAEEQLKLTQQLADLEKQIAKEKETASENKKIEENNKQISELTKEIKENNKQAADSVKEYKENTDDLIKNLEKALKIGESGGITIDFNLNSVETKYDDLEENAKSFIKQFADSVGETDISEVLSETLSQTQDYTKLAQNLSDNINEAISENLVIEAVPSETRISLFGTGDMESDKKMMIEATREVFTGVSDTLQRSLNDNVELLKSNEYSWRAAGEQLAYAYWDGMRYVIEQLKEWIKSQLEDVMSLMVEGVNSYGLTPPWESGLPWGNLSTSITQNVNSGLISPIPAGIEPMSSSISQTESPTEITVNNTFNGLSQEETAFKASRIIDRELRGFKTP